MAVRTNIPRSLIAASKRGSALVEVRAIGADKVAKAIAALGDPDSFNIMKRVVSRASTVISNEARKNARKAKDTGLLAKSIGKRTKANRRKGNVFVVVGPRTNYEGVDDRGRKRVPNNYAHLVEYGAKPHVIVSEKSMTDGVDTFGKVVSHPGSAPQPFMRPAIFNTRHRILNKMRLEMWQGLKQAIARRKVRA